MAVRIRLKRLGKIRVPHYRIVVVDSRKKRDGRVIEEVGRYVPGEDPSIIEVRSDRVQYWLSVGAQPSDAVLQQLKITGDWQKFKGLPGQEGRLKKSEAQRDSEAAIAAAEDEAEKRKAAKADEEAKAKTEAEKAAAAEKAEAPAEEAPAADAPAEEQADNAGEQDANK